MGKIIWTPSFYDSYEFGIYLDKDFAREMIQAKISNKRQYMMNELANEDLKAMRINWLNPYNFYEDTCFISSFNIGQNGVWLSTDRHAINDLLSKTGRPDKPIEYSSHNVDFPSQTVILMKLFNKWIEYADILKEKES